MASSFTFWTPGGDGFSWLAGRVSEGVWALVALFVGEGVEPRLLWNCPVAELIIRSCSLETPVGGEKGRREGGMEGERKGGREVKLITKLTM